MEVKLVSANGEDAGRETPLQRAKFFIGRADDCHLRPEDDSVARHHCVVLVEEEFIAIRDMGSKTGTFVNGDRLAGELELKDGDRIRVGEREFDLRLDSGEVEKESEPPAPQAASPDEAESPAKDDSDLHATGEDMDLDHWLDQAPIAEGADASEQPEPELPDEKRAKKKKDESVDVVGVWKKGNWKPTAVDPGQAAADTLKKFFDRH